MQPDLKTRLMANKQKAGIGTVGFLVLVCTAHLAHGLYQDIVIARTWPAEIGHSDPHSALPQTTAVSMDSLMAAHFFGSSQSPDSPPQISQAPVPETRMSLELHGVIGSSIVAEGRALIAPRGKNARYYGVDDTLPGGATLHSIATNQVVLSRNGMLETLSFPKPQSPSDTHTFAAAGYAADLPNAEDPASQYQQLHESQISGQSYSDSEQQPLGQQSEEPSQASTSIKERLKQLRESRNL